jgi:hypothetical protein
MQQFKKLAGNHHGQNISGRKAHGPKGWQTVKQGFS